eukprot:gene25590-32062_t
MLPPISSAADAAAIPPVQPIGAAAASEAAAAAPAVLSAAATVEFSDLAQFLSTVALSRRQLLELQGTLESPEPGETQLRLLNDAADALRLSFNQLPPVGGTGVADGVKRQRHGGQQRGKAQCRCQQVHDKAQHHAGCARRSTPCWGRA